MKATLAYYRTCWQGWLSQPKYVRSADLAAKLLAIMMITGGLGIYTTGDPRGTLLVMQNHGITTQAFGIVTVVLGIVLLFSGRVKMLGLIARSSPILFFIGWTLYGTVVGEVSLQGIAFLGILYSIMLLLYWGAT